MTSPQLSKSPPRAMIFFVVNFRATFSIKLEHFRMPVELFICFVNLAPIQFLKCFPHTLCTRKPAFLKFIYNNNNVNIIMRYWQRQRSVYHVRTIENTEKKSRVQLYERFFLLSLQIEVIVYR